MFHDIKRLRNDFYCIANAFNENRRLIFKYEKETSLNESEVESSNQARVEKQTEIVCWTRGTKRNSRVIKLRSD